MATNSRLSLECFCGRTYNYEADLEEHRRARGHFIAHICGRLCNHPPLPQSSIRVQFCAYCDKKCERDDIMEDHRIFTGHCFCSECDQTFDSQTALQTHIESQIHASEFRCCDCNIAFKDIHALIAHMASRAHRKPKPQTTEINEILQCQECNRAFKSANSLLQHRESVKHKPLSNLNCPVGKDCKIGFTSPSALIQHLESGQCDSGMKREKIYQLIQNFDSEKLIHRSPEGLTPGSPRLPIPEKSPMDRFPTTPGLSDDSSRWSLLTPPSGFTLDDEWLKCPLCPTEGKVFGTPRALENHIMSPIHCPKVYCCPVNMFPEGLSSHQQKQQKSFSTLGGLAQHLESGACQGGKDLFIEVVEFIERRLELFGLRHMPFLLSRG
ncbi:hypothetical protein AOQ84DRAFT_310018 [Glonium stellatum]|uniref:C2H2-type domain-containing protein n=1 Tax=Glonium stellatum TaxID=574774 RepID=A0A8E2FB59_9PEZI|nr:hypothetical protein AOQ84DRAFT_310018 [Glonium stellatum]